MTTAEDPPPGSSGLSRATRNWASRLPRMVLAGLQELVRPRPVHRKADEERKKHLAAVLNIIAGAFFAVGVLTPWTSGRPLSWGALAYALFAALLVGAARRHLRYIPEEPPKEGPNGRF